MNGEQHFDYYIGLDLGGTNIKSGIVDEQGKVVFHQLTPTPADKSSTVDAIIRILRQVVSHSGSLGLRKLLGIGIATAGRVNSGTGTVLEASNLKWKNVAIGGEISRAFGVEVILLNDTNAAALGEYVSGQFRMDNFMCITLGTGVGSGLILNGRLYEGNQFSAGEIGHIVADPDGLICVCGNRGWLETIASGPSMLRELRNRAAACGDRLLKDKIERDPGALQVADMVEAAKRGDELSISVLAGAERQIGLQIARISNLLDMDTFVIAGGIAKTDWPLIDHIAETARNHVLSSKKASLRILKSKLIDLSAIVGAVAFLVQKGSKRGRLAEAGLFTKLSNVKGAD